MFALPKPSRIVIRRSGIRHWHRALAGRLPGDQRAKVPTTTLDAIALDYPVDEILQQIRSGARIAALASTVNVIHLPPKERSLMSSALLLHIPHASRRIPRDVRQSFLGPAARLRRELLRMTDTYTDELFRLDGAARIVSPVSRLVVDVERFPNDADESMAAVGMGAIYVRDSSGEMLRPIPDAAELESLLERYYWPHHRRFERVVDQGVNRNGACLIVDCHSFASAPMPHEPDQRPERPDICIGTDGFHTPGALTKRLCGIAQAQGRTVEIDLPFAGAIVSMKHFGRTKEVRSIMIEVNRRLYMDERTGEKLSDFDEVGGQMSLMLKALASEAGS
jgi:N-formylglutamate deformylase